MPTPRRMIVLTDGYRDPHTAKTAICVIRYRPEEVVAVLDRQGPARPAGDWLGVGGAIPVVAALADAPAANTLLVGIAPPGGKMPPALAADRAGGRRPRHDRGLRPARVPGRRCRVRPGRRQHGRASWSISAATTNTTWPIAAAFAPTASASTPSPTIAVAARWSPPWKSPAAGRAGRRCRLRGHRPDRHPRGRQRLPDRPRDLRFRDRRGRKARPGQSAPRGDRRGRAGESLSSPLLGRDAGACSTA